MGFHYRLQKAEQLEKKFLEIQNDFRIQAKFFPAEDQLTDAQRQVKVYFLASRIQLAISWFEVAERCRSQDEAKQYYEKSAKLGYGPAQRKINFPAVIAIKDEAELEKYPIDRLRDAVKDLDPAACFWYAVYLDKFLVAHAENKPNPNPKMSAPNYYYYSVFQLYPPALIKLVDDLLIQINNSRIKEEDRQLINKIINEYLAQAMQQNYAEAFYRKGLQFLEGLGEEKSTQLALKYFRKAIKRGFSVNQKLRVSYRSVEPEALAEAMGDSYLGIQDAKDYLEILRKKTLVTEIENPIVKALFSLLAPSIVATSNEDAPNISQSRRVRLDSALYVKVVEQGLPLTLKAFLHHSDVSAADTVSLLKVAFNAYKNEQSAAKKQQYKKCFRILLNHDQCLDLNMLCILQVYVFVNIDEAIQNLLLEYLSLRDKNGTWEEPLIIKFSLPLFILKILLMFPAQKIALEHINSNLAESIIRNSIASPEHPLNKMLTLSNSEEIVYEANEGHSGFGVLLKEPHIQVQMRLGVMENITELVDTHLDKAVIKHQLLTELSGILQLKFFTKDTYAEFLDSALTTIKSNFEYEYIVKAMFTNYFDLENGFYAWMALLLIAVKQHVDLTPEQIKKFKINAKPLFEQLEKLCYEPGKVSVLPVIRELLLSSPGSAFWQVVNFSCEKHSIFDTNQLNNFHALRRSVDPRYIQLYTQLDKGTYDPRQIAQLIHHHLNPDSKLSYVNDYVVLLEITSQAHAADKVVFLLYICQQLENQKIKIGVFSAALFDDLVDLREDIIKYLQVLKSINPDVTELLLLDITNCNTYLGKLFDKRNLFGSQHPTVEIANKLLKELQQLKASSSSTESISSTPSSTPLTTTGQTHSWPKTKSGSDAVAIGVLNNYLNEDEESAKSPRLNQDEYELMDYTKFKKR